MIRDYVVTIAELLFYLMDGIPLLDSPWLLVYLGAGVLIMLWPILILDRVGRYARIACIVGIITFFPVLFLTMSPALAQQQMMSECSTVQVVVSSERAGVSTFDARECRRKSNFYEDHGPWKVVTLTRRVAE